MRKKHLKILSLIVSSLMLITLFSSCGKKTSTSSLTKVRLNEVTRSVFYAPMYAAISNGYFKENGIELDISTGQGADKTMQEVLSKNADIGFCGPEQVIYIYNQHRQDYPILFAQLTQKDGSFLVGRKEEKDFSWSYLKGKTIIGGRPGGVPEMALEYVLKNKNLKIGKDVNVITNIDFKAVGGAFKGGTGNYATLFEPTGSLLTQSKSGYIVSSVGAEAGTLPYTCFFSTKSYMTENKDVIQKFTNAIYKGQLWVKNHSDKEVASTIKSFFPGTSESLIENSVKNYRKIGAFAETPALSEKDLTRLMDIIQSYKSSLIKERPSFNTIVNNSFAKEAVQKIK
ncbi:MULTISPECIES: ABC transporter substrate-binding protein [Clostridium]|uniref:ABC transporter substrate-binding protein n=1 Tax=Clostridium TaxID=1485 RepID=UPI00069F1F59|nr:MULTISPECIES: ABC transporter substrate-binding protein [Clostridium]KOF57360.1 nitrate ABC transporter substrate-binding protein [Clostridium sp. DMHC 10]MCD2348603.1 ABC transporter substrate-binding protein [Clostridium guangxiense]